MNKKSNRVMTLLLVLALLAGLFLLLYPTVSDYWNSLHQSRAIATYAQAVAEVDDKQYEHMWEDAYEYNQQLKSKSNRWIMTDEEREEYESLLNVSDNGILGYIEIPKIKVSLPIYPSDCSWSHRRLIASSWRTGNTCRIIRTQRFALC